QGFFGPLSAAPSSAVSVGDFGHRLSEFRNKPRSVWLVRASFDGRPAIRVAQETSGSWGALSFGYFIFGQAKKSNSPIGEKEHYIKQTLIRVGIHAPLRLSNGQQA
ncbi:MAG: hypothetical protein CTY26_13130, partial [Methylophilus sp.]